ncbi:ATP-dependent RNA helicase DRS1 [Microthyrium microscopicum]|uniref:RNA helicase n=1 Tax=Microthyrium microscopicum TaxID=703497 RepID=A0A6A6UQ29_9PEZI|nr:ATP-dependent RNA helicase DRS1 [Microthyrium microscopicum]
MAPAREEDFVFTLSDNEDAPLESSEDEAPAAKPSKKRKHENGTSSTTNKKQKKTTVADLKPAPETSDNEEGNWADQGEDDGAMASDFEFIVGETTGVIDDFDGWGQDTEDIEKKSGDKKGVDIDSIISRRKNKSKEELVAVADEEVDEDDEDVFNGIDDDDELLAADAFGMGTESEDSEQSHEDTESEGEDDAGDAEDAADEENGASDNESVASVVPHPMDLESGSSDEEKEDAATAQRKAAFFAPEVPVSKSKSKASGTMSFQDMSLSRPILKGLAAIGFNEPTPIQTKTVPIALEGKDVVGGAVTGSGKTAAFIIPILERLLYRPKKVPTTRVAILMPTRELAVQCFNVSKKMASFTDITFAQIVGGYSVREQEQVLKKRPDIIIATPGRFIDHMRNSPSFAVDTLEILVLDEADRMLEDGFADELNEILNTIPKSRQTMLFSATMTDDIDKLIRVGMNRPARLLVDAKKQTVSGLVQEFVRLRPGREDKRLAYLMWLCEHAYEDRVIVFFRQKKEAHRVRVIFGLCGLKAAELHGSMSQEQRIHAVEAFRSGQASYLLATDLASRGLDIKNVNTVINYEAPQTHEIYLHRVGRTARAGRTGRACTIAAEPDRKVVKAAVKSARAQGAKIASRTVPPEEADAWSKRLEDLQEDIDAVLLEEKEEKSMNNVERDIRKGENLVVHEDEIKSRPKRTWFESQDAKKEARDVGRAELNGELVLGKKTKKKLSGKEKKKLDMKSERTDVRMWKKGKGDAAAAIKKPTKKAKPANTSGAAKAKKPFKPKGKF